MTQSHVGDSEALFESLLRLGDNCLILSHRLSEQVGQTHALEEELATANVALDLLGQAQLWLTLAGHVEGRNRSADDLTYFRDARAYRNVLLVEQPNGDFANTVLRQFFFDTWHFFLLQALSSAPDERVREIAQKSLKEVTYHVRRSTDWVVRLGDGSEESHKRMVSALEELWPYSGELFAADDVDVRINAGAFALDLGALTSRWTEHVKTTFAQAKLPLPKEGWQQSGGKRGVHSEHLGYLLADLQFLQRAYPGNSW